MRYERENEKQGTIPGLSCKNIMKMIGKLLPKSHFSIILNAMLVFVYDRGRVLVARINPVASQGCVSILTIVFCHRVRDVAAWRLIDSSAAIDPNESFRP